MLKKAPNTVIEVRFQIIDSDSFIKLQVAQHTVIKEIENILAKQLKINPFKISFTFQHPFTSGILNPSSTLFQNQIKNRDTIYAKIVNIQTRSQAKCAQVVGQSDQKNMTLLDVISGKPQKLESVTKGLNLHIICSNKRCFNYNKNTIMELGLGTFNYNYISTKIKCPVCPDKELNLNHVCIVKDFIFRNCLWTLEGKSVNNGIEVPHKLYEWIVVKTQDSSNFNQILCENQWTNVNIIVKEIGYPKQKIPLML